MITKRRRVLWVRGRPASSQETGTRAQTKKRKTSSAAQRKAKIYGEN